jgi:polyisoprenoid-binding protein YceI
MIRISSIILLVLAATGVQAQRYTAEKTYVSFFSQAALEDIKAENTKTTSLLDPSTSDIAFVVPVNEFQFQKSLMQEHFNEKYMETEKYPRATFQGKLTGFDAAATQAQKVTAKGKLTIHGVTKDVEIPGTIEKQGEKYVAKSEFMVKLADYKIEIPQLLWQKIAEQVKVTVNFTYVHQ